MNIELLLTAISQHARGVVTGCVLLLLVYLARLPALSSAGVSPTIAPKPTADELADQVIAALDRDTDRME